NNVEYISAALTPRVFPPGGNFGSFSVANATSNFGYVDRNGQNQVSKSSTFLATQDMVYGNPPLERFQNNTAGFDPGDLDPHGIYDTYFKEFKFQFTLAQRAVPYDVVTDPDNGPTAA